MRKSLPQVTTEKSAREIHARLVNDVHRMDAQAGALPGWAEKVSNAFATPDSWLHALRARAEKRSKDNKRDFRLSAADVEFICIRSGGRCEVTGMPFNEQRVGPRGRRPYIQSLDRIDCMAGYSLENCRLVCTVVNIAMGSWGEDVVRQMATGMVLNQFYPPWLEASGSPTNAHLCKNDKSMSRAPRVTH